MWGHLSGGFQFSRPNVVAAAAKILSSGAFYLDSDWTDLRLAPAHAYPFFRSAAQVANARFDTATEVDTSVSVDALLGAIRSDPGSVFVANPGNPTGTRISKADLVRLCRSLRNDVLLVIDEAHSEFVDHLGETCFDMVEVGNTHVLRTFSKANRLAGCRVGWGLFPHRLRANCAM